MGIEYASGLYYCLRKKYGRMSKTLYFYIFFSQLFLRPLTTEIEYLSDKR